jgi:hypothetical protein
MQPIGRSCATSRDAGEGAGIDDVRDIFVSLEISSSTVQRLWPRTMISFLHLANNVAPRSTCLAARLIARPAPWQVLPKVSCIAFSLPVSTYE